MVAPIFIWVRFSQFSLNHLVPIRNPTSILAISENFLSWHFLTHTVHCHPDNGTHQESVTYHFPNLTVKLLSIRRVYNIFGSYPTHNTEYQYEISHNKLH